MSTYIMLLNWTEQGMEKIKASPKRLNAGKKAFRKMGVEIKQSFLTMGQYDLVCIIEAPDPETAAKAVLSLGADGNVRTLTLPAFTEDEYRKIIDSL